MEVVVAEHGAEVSGMVELFLRAVRKPAREAPRATSCVLRIPIHLLPVRADDGAVPEPRIPAIVLVVVRVDALLPVVEGADGAPLGLVRPHEEVRRDVL